MDSRKRNIKSANETSNDGQQKQHDSTHDRKKLAQGTRLGDEYVIVCLILAGAALAGIAHYAMESYLPLPEDRQLHRMDFNYRKAREHLVSLTDFGPRVVGSVENEVLAPKYIMDQLEKIQANDLNKELFEMQFEVFRTDGGSFALEFLHEYISVYRNIASVILRILPKKTTPASALLFNCHYDTVADSPGAGDDTASCALMLEMARATVSSDQPLENALVFLWNGAEENMLQASHAFVTQHRWFAGPPRIAAFVNLDAAGSSGREIAFQIGPENPWLIEAYAKTVRYAWASILAQEFFEVEIIPGVTDYRQFRDTGRLPGVVKFLLLLAGSKDSD